MAEFEYFVGFIGNGIEGYQRDEVMNEWGKSGWEFTGHSEKAMGGAGRNYYMKRVKPIIAKQQTSINFDRKTIADAIMEGLDSYRREKGLLNDDPEDKDDPRPCQGGNTNICVGEGCYGEACLKVAKDEPIAHKVSLPCPKCSRPTLICWYYRDPATGNHQHTRYQCTSWPHPGNPCGWNGWTVPS
jgi:hypothetical protein